jgi:hypothetical protein
VIRHLVLPGLLGPLPAGADPAQAPRLRHVERLLARGRREPAPAGLERQLFRLFGLDALAGADELPTAALSYRHDHGRVPAGWVMHADPVHLRPDQDRLLLFDAAGLDIAAGEAASLVDLFNRHFAGDGLRLSAPHPARWYLEADEEPAITTVELSKVVGRNIDASLPDGPRAVFWRQLLNEVQMLFFDAPVNQARDAQGRPGVSGLWLSGVGRMPARGRSSIVEIHGDAPLLRGLAAASEPLGRDALVLDDVAWRAVLDADATAWTRAVQAMDARLGAWLEEGGDLAVHPCDGESIHWDRAGRRRWWRRARPFGDWLARPLHRD